MSKSHNMIAIAKGTSKLARARFGPGMLLRHDDLEQLNSYTRDLSRLMFRSLLGCGVICGLVVKIYSKCGKVEVSVSSGLALECSGDPVYVPDDATFVLDDNCDPNLPSPLWVVLYGTVKCCAPRNAVCSDEDESHTDCTREREGFEIRVVREPPMCVCRCPDPAAYEKPVIDTQCKCANSDLPCYKDHYDGKCGCNCGECSDCDCNGVLLARLDSTNDEQNPWRVDHRVRRFIRPMLMRDPEVAREIAGTKKDEETLELDEISQATERLVKAAEESTQRRSEEAVAKKARSQRRDLR